MCAIRIRQSVTQIPPHVVTPTLLRQVNKCDARCSLRGSTKHNVSTPHYLPDVLRYSEGETRSIDVLNLGFITYRLSRLAELTSLRTMRLSTQSRKLVFWLTSVQMGRTRGKCCIFPSQNNVTLKTSVSTHRIVIASPSTFDPNYLYTCESGCLGSHALELTPLSFPLAILYRDA